MELIDKNEFAKILYENIRNDNLRIYAEVCNHLKDIPTVDAVPVVRCKDCKYNTSPNKCLHPKSIIDIPEDDDFCSYGKRRNND